MDHVIRHVLIHEIGHHFGFSAAGMARSSPHVSRSLSHQSVLSLRQGRRRQRPRSCEKSLGRLLSFQNFELIAGKPQERKSACRYIDSL